MIPNGHLFRVVDGRMLEVVFNVLNVAIMTAVRLQGAGASSSSRHHDLPTIPLDAIKWPMQPIPLVIGGFFPLSRTNQSGLGHAAKIAAYMALNDVRRSRLLRGYNLTMVLRDTQCKASEGTKAFFDMMNSTDRKLALYGAACTEVNEPIAMTAKYWDIVQVSYAETHPKFSATDKQINYPTFYKMAPSKLLIHQAQYRFLAAFKWTKIGTVVQSDEPSHALPHESFIRGFEKGERGTVVATQGFSSNHFDLSANLDQLKRDARVIVGHFNENYAHLVFCEIYKKEMFGGHYVWIMPGFYNDQWWRAHDNETGSCTSEELLKALDGHFIMEFIKIRHDTKVSYGIRAPDNFKKSFLHECRRQPGCVKSQFAGYAYDGIWTLALALNGIVTDFYKINQFLFDPGIYDHSYSDAIWKGKLMDALNATNFEGVTGKVQFLDNERLGRIRLAQFQNNKYEDVGEYDAADRKFSLWNYSIVWKGGGPPQDSTTVREEYRYTNLPVFFAMSALTTLGMVLSIAFLTVNIIFRNHKFIKMSSPNMNNLIIAGSILEYLSIILLGIDTRIVSPDGFGHLCAAKAWILCFGFTLAFGSMFSKTWRVHSIFTNIKLNKKAIRDYQLLLLVGGMLLMDSVIMSVWAIFDPMFRDEKRLPPERDVVKNLEIRPIVEFCNSRHSTIFQGIIFVYKGLLLVLGCFLAWETRHVNVPALNDSKFIGMSVYNVVIMCSIGVALSFILQDKVNESFILISIFILFCTTLTLCLVFMPKMIELIRNPKGTDRNYRRTWMKSALERIDSNKVVDSVADDVKDRIVKAEQDNIVWNQMLEERNRQITALMAQLKQYGYEGDVSADSAIDNGSSGEASSHAESHINFNDPYGGIYVGPSGNDVPLIHMETRIPPPPAPSVHKHGGSPRSPLPDDINERTSLLQSNEPRQGSGKVKNHLQKLKTSLSRHSCQEEDEETENTAAPPLTPTNYYSIPQIEGGVPLITLPSCNNSAQENGPQHQNDRCNGRFVFRPLSAVEEDYALHRPRKSSKSRSCMSLLLSREASILSELDYISLSSNLQEGSLEMATPTDDGSTVFYGRLLNQPSPICEPFEFDLNVPDESFYSLASAYDDSSFEADMLFKDLSFYTALSGGTTTNDQLSFCTALSGEARSPISDYAGVSSSSFESVVATTTATQRTTSEVPANQETTAENTANRRSITFNLKHSDVADPEQPQQADKSSKGLLAATIADSLDLSFPLLRLVNVNRTPSTRSLRGPRALRIKDRRGGIISPTSPPNPVGSFPFPGGASSGFQSVIQKCLLAQQNQQASFDSTKSSSCSEKSPQRQQRRGALTDMDSVVGKLLGEKFHFLDLSSRDRDKEMGAGEASGIVLGDRKRSPADAAYNPFIGRTKDFQMFEQFVRNNSIGEKSDDG